MPHLKRQIHVIPRCGLRQVLSVYGIGSWIALRAAGTVTAALGLRWRNAFAAVVTMLVLLPGLACTRAAEIRPEDATQRFVTSASPREALEAAIRILEAMDFEVVKSGEGLARGERPERIFGTGAPPYHVPYSYIDWVRLDLAAEESASGTLVTIVPRRMHEDSHGTRQLGELTGGDIELCEKLAAELREALGQR